MTVSWSQVLAWARLVRIPNVFTALADIGLCALVAGPFAVGLGPAVLLGLASACLYCAGMVWNDYFDVEQDKRERPFRPLPSGAVSLPAAFRLGVLLLAAGWLSAVAAGWVGRGHTAAPAVVAGFLVAAILLYDRWLKRTRGGPVAMGACRFLNVLLGFSAVGPDVVPWGVRLHVACVVGVYITGVTWFARTEARASDPAALLGAVVVMAAALVLGLILPLQWPEGTASPLFVYLLAAFGIIVGLPAWRAVKSPTPSLVQRAVKRAVLGLVALDAILASAAAGAAGLVLLLLLPPAVLLGRRVYST